MLTKEQLQERTQLVRIHEANCNLEFPTPSEANFRVAIMEKLATEFGAPDNFRRFTLRVVVHASEG